jgi:hypothetical protein
VRRITQFGYHFAVCLKYFKSGGGLAAANDATYPN